MTRGYGSPKPVPQWLVRKVQRDCRKEEQRQLREDYGLDPERDILITATRYLDGSYKFAAYGATYQHRAELRRAGFVWHAQAHMWYQDRYKPCLSHITAPLMIVELVHHGYSGKVPPISRKRVLTPDEFRREPFRPAAE